VADAGVVGIAAVGGIPLVGTGHRAGGRQGEAGGRGVGAVAVDGNRLGVHGRGAAVVKEREGDGAGRVEAALQVRGVVERHRRRVERNRGRTRSGGQRRDGGTDRHLFACRPVVADRVVVTVAVVDGVPLVDTNRGAAARQGEAGRRGVGAVAV